MVSLEQSKLAIGAIGAFTPSEFTWAQDNELTRLLWRDMLKNYAEVNWNDFIDVNWDDEDVPAVMTEMVVQARHRHNVIFHKQRKNWKDVTQRTTKAAFEVEYSLALYFHLKGEGAGPRLTKKVHRAQFMAQRQEILERRADYIPTVGARMAPLNKKLAKLFSQELEKRTGDHPPAPSTQAEQTAVLKRDCSVGKRLFNKRQFGARRMDRLSRVDNAALQDILLIKTRAVMRRDRRTRRRAERVSQPAASSDDDSLNEDEEADDTFNKLIARRESTIEPTEQVQLPERAEAPEADELVNLPEAGEETEEMES